MSREAEVRVSSPSLGARPFVGRRRERSLLEEELRRGVRLLTLTGPSGIGKTTLAVQVARDAGPAFEGGGGARVCDLAACRDAAELEAEVARTLGFPNARGQVLAEALAGRGPLLLVLDNLDSLVHHAVRPIGEWLDRCVEMQVLATSIVPLGMEDEHRFELGPLEPADAAALFLDRARRAWLNRPVPEDDAAHVDELVRRLDGIPLAIELAAARVRVLPPRALLDRLDERLELLQGGGSGRHGSLVQALSLTWEFLSTAERAALARFSLFEGGFTLEAAGAILGDEGKNAAVEVLDSLRAKSLVQVDEEARFSLLESVRAFAHVELQRDDPAREVARRHATWFAEEGEMRAASLDGEGAGRAIRWLMAERPNLMAAQQRIRSLDAALAARIGLVLMALQGEMDSPPPGAELVEALLHDAKRAGEPEPIVRALRSRALAWRRKARLDEALRDLDDAIALTELHDLGAQQGRALVERAYVHIRLGGHERARDDVARTMALAHREADRLLEGLAHLAAGAEAMARGSSGDAKQLYRRARSLLSSCGDRRHEAEALLWIGSACVEEGRFGEAGAAVREAGELFRRIESRTAEASVLLNLGGLHLAAGDLAAAEEANVKAVDLSRRLGHRRNEAVALANLGLVALETSRFALGEKRLREACAILELGSERRYHVPLLPFLALAVAEAARREPGPRRWDESARLMGEAKAFFVELGDRGNLLVVEVLESLIALWRAQADGEDVPSAEEAARRTLSATRQGPSSECLFPAVRLLEKALGGREPPGEAQRRDADEAIVVAADASWFEVRGGERVSLRRRNTLRRLLDALVEMRLGSPGVGIGQKELFRQVWEGEKAQAEAAARRVYFAVWTLRGLGLADSLLSRGDGYLLDPEVALVRADQDPVRHLRTSKASNGV